MGIFRDRKGKRVKAGDTVLIEATYSGYGGQGQRCLVNWDASVGQYTYIYRIAHHNREANFDGVSEFVKVEASGPA